MIYTLGYSGYYEAHPDKPEEPVTEQEVPERTPYTPQPEPDPEEESLEVPIIPESEEFSTDDRKNLATEQVA